jgi:uncharacterized OB-fold protein
MTTEYRKPLPHIEPDTRAFWEGCKKRDLYLPRCLDCGEFHFYPRAICTYCQSQNLSWVRSSGKGQVHTFTITRQNMSRGFREELPYVLAVVELDEGVQLTTNIVGCPPDEVKIGMPVMVTFEDVTPEITLPKFRPRA